MLSVSFLLPYAGNFTLGRKIVQEESDDIAATIPQMDGGFSRRLSELMDERGVTGGDVARLLGVTRTAVSAWKHGRVANMKAIYTLKLAQFFNVNPRWLETGFGRKDLHADERTAPETPPIRYDVPHTVPAPLRSVPLLKWEQASHYRGGVIVGAADVVPVAAEVSPMAFAIKQQGDAMSGADPHSIPDGTTVVIDPSAEYGHGSIVLAKRPADILAVLRMIWFDGGVPYLKALNPSFPMLDMPPNTVVIGKAVFTQNALP